MNVKSERLAIILSGGGERVVPWQTGVLAGLADAGVDPRRATALLGTSAGSVPAARTALGCDPRADAKATAASPPPPVPEVIRRAASEAVLPLLAIWTQTAADDAERRRRAGAWALTQAPAVPAELHLARNGARVPQGAWPEALRLAAIDADSGERVVLSAGSDAAVAEGVAAGRALPRLVAPIRVGGRRLIDGAIGSLTNADLLGDVDADVAIVVTATPTEAGEGTVDALWNAALQDEVGLLRSRGIVPVVVHASPAARAAMGDDLMCVADARAAVTAGRAQGCAAGAALFDAAEADAA